MFTALITALAAWWIADEFVTIPIYMTDEKGNFIGWKKSKYKNLFDFLKHQF